MKGDRYELLSHSGKPWLGVRGADIDTLKDPDHLRGSFEFYRAIPGTERLRRN